MIWNSMTFATTFDFVMLTFISSVYLFFFFYRYKIKQYKVRLSATIISISLFLIAIYHVFDLYLVWASSEGIAINKKLVIIQDLHHDYSWIIVIVCTTCIATSFYRILSVYHSQYSATKKTSHKFERLSNQLNRNVDHLTLEMEERKRIEDKLRKSEKKYRDLVETSQDLIWTVDEKGRWTFLNEATKRIYGYEPDEMLGRPFLEFLSKEQLKKDLEAFESIKSGEPRFNYETVHIRKDGMPIHMSFNATAIKDKDGNVIGTTGTARDITKRKQAELALEQSEKKFRNYFDLGLIGMAITDPNAKKWLIVNDELCEIFGYTRKELVTKSWLDLTYPDDLKEDLANFNRVMAGETDGYEMEKRFIRKDRKIIYASISVKCARKPDGSVDYFVAIIQDITKRKNAEKKSKKLINELEEKNAELERFTYTVSHDLKSPLITIRGFLELLEKDIYTYDRARISKDVEYIKEATAKMQNLLNDLLELSRVGRIIGTQTTFPLDRAINEARSQINQFANHRTFNLHVQEQLPLINADYPRVVEVIQNLLENAIKFMGHQKHPYIEIGTTIKNGKKCVFVMDNGVGIEPEFQHRIFDLFDRIDPQIDGTGIGLAIAKRIIEVHGGEIWVESKGINQGSTFYFTLPYAQNMEVANA